MRSGSRSATTTPTQALFLMNNEFVYQAAMGASFPLIDKHDARELSEKIDAVFLATLGRKPASDERQHAEDLVTKFNPARDLGTAEQRAPVVAAAFEPGAMLQNLVPSIVLQPQAKNNLDSMAQAAPWTMLYHALMETAEFRFLR